MLFIYLIRPVLHVESFYNNDQIKRAQNLTNISKYCSVKWMKTFWNFVYWSKLICLTLIIVFTKYSAFNRREDPQAHKRSCNINSAKLWPSFNSRNQHRLGMKRTNCPKFFVRTKVDNSGSRENTSTRNKIFIVTIFLKMHNAQLFASQARETKSFLVVLFICLIYLWFSARGWTKWSKWHWAAGSSLGSTWFISD